MNDLQYFPKVWYPQGAGGMWLNYLFWVCRNNTTLPDPLVSFEYPNLKNLNPYYNRYIEITKHVDDPAVSQLRLGGPYWFNFYINFAAKKSEGIRDCARALVAYANSSIDFNLDWKWIYTDPEKFIFVINELTNSGLRYTSPVASAFEQYRSSCPRYDIHSKDFQQTELFQSWASAVGLDGTYLIDYTQQYYLL